MVSTSAEDEKHMRKAIAAAREGMAAGQTPFGACIVKGGRIIASAHNSVWADTDITAHAEVNAIRRSCGKRKAIDLSGCTIYSTVEPCPMCFSAIHWANIDRIVYGAAIGDARAAGFRELTISNRRMRAMGKCTVKVSGGVLAKECRELLSAWSSRGSGKVY